MQHYRIDVSPVGPDDRAGLDTHLTEKMRITTQRLKHRAAQQILNIHVTRGPVAEREPQDEA